MLKACNFTKRNTRPWDFFMFFKLCKWYQIAQHITNAVTCDLFPFHSIPLVYIFCFAYKEVFIFWSIISYLFVERNFKFFELFSIPRTCVVYHRFDAYVVLIFIVTMQFACFSVRHFIVRQCFYIAPNLQMWETRKSHFLHNMEWFWNFCSNFHLKNQLLVKSWFFLEYVR